MDVVGCVGREHEIARLRGHVADARHGLGAVVLLEGPAGIGKSTLARACLQLAEGAGGSAVLVGSFGPRLETPLGLWARLAAALAHRGHPVPSDLLDGAAEQLHPHARYAAVHALAGSIRPAPAVVVFDDLHDADETSLVSLAQLAPAVPALGLVIVGTSRGAAAHRHASGRDAIEALVPWASVITVDAMSPDDVRTMTLAVTGQSADIWASEAQEALTERSAGNPLVLRSLLSELGVAHGARPTSSEVASIPRRPAAEVLGRRLATLSDSCLEMLEVVALLGGAVSPSLVGDVLGRDIWLELDQAIASGVLEDRRDDDMLRFVHPVFAEAVEARIGRGSRTAHRAAADALQRRALPSDLTAIVRHLQSAGPHASSEELGKAALLAADHASRAGDHIGAGRLYDTALDTGAVGEPVELSLRSAAAHLFGGSRESGWGRARQAFSLAGPDRPADRARAALLFAQQRDYSTDTPAAVELLRTALSGLGEGTDDHHTRLRTEVLAALSVLEMSLPVPVEIGELGDVVDVQGKPTEGLAWYWITRPEVARPLADEALQLARASGDGDLFARAAYAWRQSYCNPSHLPDRLAVTAEAAAGASSPSDRALAAIATVLDQLEAGSRPAVDRALDELAGLAAATGDPALRWRHGQLAAMLAMASGRPNDAERLSAEAMVHGAQAGEDGRWVVRVVQSISLTIDSDADPEPAVDLVVENLDSLAYPPMRGGALAILAEAGRTDIVSAHLQQMVSHVVEDPGREASWLSAAASTADAVATMGRQDLAEDLLHVITPYAEHIALDGLGLHCHGCVARPAARLAALLDRHDEAAEFRAVAIDRDRLAGLDRFLLADELDDVEARLRLGTEDEQSLRTELERLHDRARGLGLRALERRARRITHGGPAIDLTARQHDVLIALAEGLTYQSTGERLGFSHSTIRHEAMRVYAALGVRDRDEAVEIARRRGLLPA